MFTMSGTCDGCGDDLCAGCHACHACAGPTRADEGDEDERASISERAADLVRSWAVDENITAHAVLSVPAGRKIQRAATLFVDWAKEHAKADPPSAVRWVAVCGAVKVVVGPAHLDGAPRLLVMLPCPRGAVEAFLACLEVCTRAARPGAADLWRVVGALYQRGVFAPDTGDWMPPDWQNLDGFVLAGLDL
jgi:hypothetical protein